MRAYVILNADDTDYSTQYGYSNVVCIKYRENQAKRKIEELKAEDDGEYYYEEISISLGDIPTIATDQYITLLDIDAYNSTIQMDEAVIAARIKEIEELKKEVSRLKGSVASESARATRENVLRAKTEQELRTLRKEIKAAKKVDKPEFLGFEDKDGKFYPTDPYNKNNALLILSDELGASKFSFPISYFRKKVGELKPVYAAVKAE